MLNAHHTKSLQPERSCMRATTAVIVTFLLHLFAQGLCFPSPSAVSARLRPYPRFIQSIERHNLYMFRVMFLSLVVFSSL